jgi:opacity protein-like surface antigen
MPLKDRTMNRALLAATVTLTPGLLGSVPAADLSAKTPPSVPAPFSWSSCYFGMHAGGGFAGTDITDPVQLAQDGILGAGATIGVTTTHVTPSGAVIGGQLGCDHQFAPNWVAGIEGAASGTTLKGSATTGLPAGFPGDQAVVTSRTDFLPSVTGRLGYAIDRTLIYGKAGVAWAGDKYSVAGTLQGTGFSFDGFDMRTGWIAGAGVEWAFSRNWSANLEYDYYSFGSGTAFMLDNLNGFTGQMDTGQSVQVVKVGVNFHMWSGW